MSSFKFSQLANKVVSTAQSTIEKTTAKTTPVVSSAILYEKDIDTMANRVLPRVMQTRGISGISKNAGEVPPKLEDFDPLNPGKWQVGVGGKILPRLPEGTRVGKLVMGKYGLYSPTLRKRVEAYSAGLDAGLKSEEATPYDKKLSIIGKILAYTCGIIAVWNTATLIYGKPLPPYHNHKAPGSS